MTVSSEFVDSALQLMFEFRSLSFSLNLLVEWFYDNSQPDMPADYELILDNLNKLSQSAKVTIDKFHSALSS